MNERIKELAEQARKKPLGNSWCYTNPTEFEQKFAELIVRECIANCDDLNSMKYIANHFGIKVEGLES
jgi:hypothetical protein